MRQATWARSLGTVVGMILFAAIMVSAMSLIAYMAYEFQEMGASLSSHNIRVSTAMQSAGDVCSSWIYSPAAHVVLLNITNRSPRPARLVGVVMLYDPNNLAAFNETGIIPPGGRISLEIPSPRRPVTLVLALIVNGVAVQSSCIRG